MFNLFFKGGVAELVRGLPQFLNVIIATHIIFKCYDHNCHHIKMLLSDTIASMAA